MKSFLDRLRAPFPSQSSLLENAKGLFGIGLFVAAFLYLLRPFGISGMNGVLFWICLGFGGVTVVFGLVFQLVCDYLLKIRTDVPSWTLWKWLVQACLLLLWVGLGNYLFMILISDATWKGESLINMLINTIVVGVFPIVFSGLMIQMRSIKKNQTLAGSIKSKKQDPSDTLSSHLLINQGSSAELRLDEGGFFFAEAMQNYVAIHYNEAGELTKKVIRYTLSKLESDCEGTTIIRCHRSYIVNPQKIESISGNAQGLKLKIKNCEVEIPVSRSFIPTLKKSLD
ncbi:LytR/AlgR family response regulator transcription factor [Luteibaculum oceani]|uniref:LytTR family transcriptional regulator n=1 Tax=Luteibaculum oceani TaxID=1294296 RepID=A0A5C6VDJ6_9FLAO|nr:LytTR family DNA-binding domain-containing protein [Luteibaculum oceani]TXC81765.1 LytTR family transcriptional regulator [Luteibaculum oceani]